MIPEDETREKHLISNEIAVLMEDRAIERPALARLCGMPEAELDRLLEADVQTVEIGKLWLVLTALKGME
ncbi:hypothetical protein CN198_14255 [Sinorhizobium meliloti]|uniref:XRE family transcriptional regulator n=1 Tax=Rhizobium meliloti TaxID=382 RepID=UPI000FD743F5|nr:XRE family transcriptional regulator [Sinorhizobium meliloti]RVH69218.1 hypothetical protein CN198_14255 [Sinorhizobium meliloti]